MADQLAPRDIPLAHQIGDQFIPGAPTPQVARSLTRVARQTEHQRRAARRGAAARSGNARAAAFARLVAA